MQEVYRLQGVEINDKHIEIIIRQMLRKVKITEPGDTTLPLGRPGRQARLRDRKTPRSSRRAASPPKASRCCSASPRPRSKPTASSPPRRFQDTTRVLTEAATLGKIDNLRGFKENVIMGHLIPAGTGFPAVREIKLVELGEQVGTPLMEEAEPQPALG